MTIGTPNNPGKYDVACTVAREQTGAALAALFVLGGKNGTGFSVQAIDQRLLLALPELLETAAKEIRKDLAGLR